MAEICARHDVLIVEDDVYGFLPDPILETAGCVSAGPGRAHLKSVEACGPGIAHVS